MTTAVQPHNGAKDMDAPQFLVLAIGISAENLAALSAVISAVAEMARVAIIIAPRFAVGDGGVDPESLAADLGRPVTSIADDAPILPGRLYVTPAHALVGVRKGRFRLRPPRNLAERRAPVDYVLRALARDFGSRAIAISLAADGSDGVLGLQAVAAAGGMTMAQAVETAPGAPENRGVQGSAFVDHVLRPDELARALGDYVKFLIGTRAGDEPRRRRRDIQEELPEICSLLRDRTGVDFKHYRTTTLVRRIERRMHVLCLASVRTYVERLADEHQESHALFRELLIGVTSFFRDPDAFASLARNALAPIFKDRSHADTVRIWVAACATGEEAYSIAMLVREILDQMKSPPRVQIFATDANEKALATARRAYYPQGIATSVSPERLARFFIKRGRRYHVAQELRELVLFSAHNVIADPPFSRLDLISCRNLLIYLGSHLQKKLIPLFHYALRSGGYLFLGSSESLAGHGELFRDIDIRNRLAQRKDTPLPIPSRANEPSGHGPPGARDTAARPAADLGAVAQRIVLDEFAPRYAIVNEDGQVVFLSEGVERYIQPPAGAYSNNIMRMARRGLSVGLRAAFNEALRNRRTAVGQISMRTSEGPAQVRLTVQPMPELGLEEGLYMLVFQDLGAVPAPARPEQLDERSDAHGVIMRLEQELIGVREELDRTVQDLEAANEELKSSNEELLSMNEELQSANEELEASREDVQFAHDELAVANADLENHLRAMRIATIFLDQQGTVRGFTPAASEIYHLAPGDAGRPLRHFTHVLVEPPALPSLEEVAASSDPIEHEVRASDGRWLTRRVLPYRDKSGAIGGLVLTFIDVTRQKRQEEQARRAVELLDSVAQVTDDLIYVKDRDSRLLFANPAMYRLTGHEAGDRMPNWHADQAEAAAIIANDRRIIETGLGEVVEEAFTPAGGATRFFSSNKKPMRDPEGEIIGIVGVSSDITEYKHVLAERDRLLAQVDEERKRLAALLKTLPAGVVIGEAPAGRITFVNDAAVAYLGEWVRNLNAFSEGGNYRMQTSDGRDLEPENFPLARTRRGESFVGEETVIIRPDAGRGVFSVSGNPLRDAGGSVSAGVITFVDISERMRTQAALAKSEHNYRALFEQAAVGIEQASIDGRLMAVNDRLCAMLGYSRQELLTKTFVDITDPADLPRERRRHKRLTTGKTDSYAFEKRYVRRNGTRLWARVTSSLARDEKGAVLYRISIIEDVSERRRAQAELRDSEARYRATFEQAAIGIAHVALDGRWLSVNDRICAITGYSREELLRSRFQDMTHPDDLDSNLALVAELLRGDRDNLTMEKRYLRKDGAVVWARVSAVLVHDGEGAPAYLISVIEDITEDLRSALTDARLAAIVRSSQDAIYSFDQDDLIGSWNNGAVRLFGYEPEEVIGRSHALLVPEDRKAQAREAIARVKSGEAVVAFESERRRKDGAVFACLVTKSPIHGARGELLGFSSIVRDITERRLWEERQRLMARELVHRVKNSFAVIQSIVRQTQRSTPEPEAFALAFSGRLAAMAAAHDLLTDRHWEGAGLRDLITSQLAPFAAGAEKRVHAEGPEVTLDTSLAVPLGLALHELATNAAKYGALSKPGGRVDLTWNVQGEGDAQQLTLVWRERGGPPVAAPKRRGFGTSLIERGLPDARIERRFDPEGLVCRIELPTSGVRLEGS